MAKVKNSRLFLNQVDSFHGLNFSKFLSQCVVGASLEETEEEEDDNGSMESGFQPIKPKDGCYEIYGTLKDKTSKKPDGVKEIINFETREQLYEHIVEYDIIVYDITQDADQIEEALWIISEMHSNFDKIESQKVFILISTLMTWAKSKPLDPDDPEIPFTEEDYRRRKPHPNFKDHIGAEKSVLKLGKTNKSKLISYVVASGLTYGCEENVFHYLFKSAWHNAQQLVIFGNGENILPTIHIKDLAAVIQNVADSRPKPKYLVAVDDSKNSLQEIVKAISSTLCTGKVKSITKEEALMSKEIEQNDFDQLLVSLRIDAIFVKENMRINWAAETGIVENIAQVVKEYKFSRGLLPFRIAIFGPPASGKTLLAKQLCEMYKLHHVHIKDVIEEAMNNLERSAARSNVEEGEEDDDGKAAEDAELLESVNESRAENNGRIENQHIKKFFYDKLLSKPCQNQGYVLDGYPKSREQAEELFAADEEDDEGDEKRPSFNKLIMPDYLFLLDASDSFLNNRIMMLPELVVAGTHNTEEGLLRRLADYRSINTEDDTVINYFDEREVHPEFINVMEDNSSQYANTIARLRKILGKSRNYGLTAEEKEAIRLREEEAKLRREADERADKERKEEEETNLRKLRQEEWAARLEDVKREEYETLEAKSLPLRNYLMQHVMPVLTQGLMDCAKSRPEDAIDFLAEYLFRNNPQID